MYVLGGINKGHVSEVLDCGANFFVTYQVTDREDAYTTKHNVNILKTETNNPAMIAASLGKPIEVSIDHLGRVKSAKIDGVSVVERNFPVKSTPSRNMFGRALRALHLTQ